MSDSSFVTRGQIKRYQDISSNYSSIPGDLPADTSVQDFSEFLMIDTGYKYVFHRPDGAWYLTTAFPSDESY